MYIHKVSFLILLMSGTMLSVSSSSWFSAWIGLEVNLLSFIPLMKNGSNSYSSESSIKYFVVQALGSMMTMFSMIALPINKSMILMLNLGLLLKMGAAPMRSWFPEVIMGLNWTSALMLMTWQKIAPMALTAYSMQKQHLVTLFILASSMIGGILSLNQTNLSKILAYSSINHIGWMLAALVNSWMIWIYYFLIYSAINTSMIYIFNKNKMSSISQINKLQSYPMLKLLMTMNLLSLGGLPPFLGFLPKWLTIMTLSFNNFIVLGVPLIMFTLLALFFYLRTTFNYMMLVNSQSLNLTRPTTIFFYLFMNFIFLVGLLITPAVMNMF